MKWEGRISVPVQKLLRVLRQYKLVLLVLAVGLVLMLWPQSGGTGETQTAATQTETGTVFYDVEALERKMEETLSQINGAGNVKVLLTLKSGTEQIYATDTEYSEDGESREESTSTVLVSTGSGTEEAVLVQQVSPTFQGALVVCDGGDDPTVKLYITQAVAALTGLGSDKITVCR